MAGRVKIKPGGKIERLTSNLDRPEAALKKIGALLLEQSQKAFRNQEWDGKKWPTRKVPNVFGIISDFSKSGNAKPPKRRFEKSPVLIDTGQLRRTLSMKIVGNDSVEVGSNLPYATVHNYGGPVESKPITASVQQKLKRWLTSKEGMKWQSKLIFLTLPKMLGQKIRGKVPPRPFVGLNKEARERIYKLVGVHVMEAK